jgi:hypothetical protein
VPVVSETSRSYVLQGGKKIPKNAPRGYGYAFTKEMVDQDVWMHHNKEPIIQAIKRSSDCDMLRQFAAALNVHTVVGE